MVEEQEGLSGADIGGHGAVFPVYDGRSILEEAMAPCTLHNSEPAVDTIRTPRGHSDTFRSGSRAFRSIYKSSRVFAAIHRSGLRAAPQLSPPFRPPAADSPLVLSTRSCHLLADLRFRRSCAAILRQCLLVPTEHVELCTPARSVLYHHSHHTLSFLLRTMDPLPCVGYRDIYCTSA